MKIEDLAFGTLTSVKVENLDYPSLGLLRFVMRSKRAERFDQRNATLDRLARLRARPDSLLTAQFHP